MNAIIAMIDEIQKDLEDADRVPAGVFVMLEELREQVRNYKCIHELVKEFSENTTTEY